MLKHLFLFVSLTHLHMLFHGLTPNRNMRKAHPYHTFDYFTPEDLMKEQISYKLRREIDPRMKCLYIGFHVSETARVC